MNDDAKKAVLARRAKFIAAALAGVSVACGKEPSQPPQPCLSQPMEPRDAAAEPPPQPCLTPMQWVPPDAESPSDAGAAPITDAGTTTNTKAPDAGPPRPVPCLAPPLPSTKPVPLPCLTPMRRDPQK